MLEQYTFTTDPLLILMAAECETVEDELECEAQAEQRETVLMAAKFITNLFNPE
jgi:hypothetical protein